jgi:HEAT repeat protein
LEVLANSNGYFHSVVRAAAASSLGQIGDLRGVEPLLAAIADPIAEVSSESIRALATLGDVRAVDTLINVVENPTGYFLPVTRQAAILALAKLGGEQAVSELQIIASSAWEEPAIRSAAESGITSIAA